MWTRNKDGSYSPHGWPDYRIVKDAKGRWRVGNYSADLLRTAKAHVEEEIDAKASWFNDAVREQAEHWMDEGMRHGSLDLGFAAGIILDELEKRGKLYAVMDRATFEAHITRVIVEDAATVASAFFEDVDEAMNEKADA